MSLFHLFGTDRSREDQLIEQTVLKWNGRDPVAVSEVELRKFIADLGKLYTKYNDLRSEEFDDRERQLLTARLTIIGNVRRSAENLLAVNLKAMRRAA